MSRRRFVLWGIGLYNFVFGPRRIQTAYGAASEETGHMQHQWVAGPFYVPVAMSGEEPQYYPPQGLLPIEHCLTCGLLRLPKEYWTKTGINLENERTH